ncbi:MAG: SulP family inorganic anion transporter [Pyrinomonadaceae bacterium MAG19_C2-C3]|nr:SulP family inorganic anion transporter [Pyrinomonadaceae bacterium MAG19_C2-C3]
MNNQTFIKDLLAGLTVSFAALSLGAAFGTMSGRGAFAGMIGAAVIPIITSLIGGTRLQASGPTAPMTAVTAVVVANTYELFPDKALAEQFITLILLMLGALMILSGLLRLGKLILYVPNAVVLGFMNGIAVLIWYDQIAKIFGFGGKTIMEGSSAINVLVAVGVVIFIFTLPLFIRKIGVPEKYRSFFSAVLLSVIVATLLSNLLNLPIEKVKLGNSIDSISEFLTLIGNYFPDSRILTTENLVKALPFAVQLMILGYLDSLLTALVIDRMTKETTNQNKELIAQGIANGVVGIMQGIPGAQATIRSVLLIKEDAQTRLAGVLMGVFVLIFLIFFSDWVALIPAAVFSGVLFKAGWDVSDREFTRAYIKRGWVRSFNRNFQLFIILYTTAVTVLIDLNVAVISATIMFYLFTKLGKSDQLIDVEHELEDEID